VAKTSATTKRKKKTVKFASETIYRVDENGELQPIPAEVIDEEWDETVDINFDKIWLSSVLEALEQVGNKKIKVANYILNNRDKTTNYLIKTQREIAEECGVSLQTVSSTLKALEKADMLIGKSGVYQVNPERIARGKHNKRMAILRIYQQNKASKE
jgi:DNA-binding transcriptional regulator YhcF (GntR family)